jgi:RND superfamily putative drug exporter
MSIGMAGSRPSIGVFLYSRMHEIYDKTGDSRKSIIEGVAKTGPIITAAAVVLFVVVAAFATSRISIMQQIGIGLSIAVLVDAFFVRIFFVPAVMELFGKKSWWAPKWLKKFVIRHE